MQACSNTDATNFGIWRKGSIQQQHLGLNQCYLPKAAVAVDRRIIGTGGDLDHSQLHWTSGSSARAFTLVSSPYESQNKRKYSAHAHIGE